MRRKPTGGKTCVECGKIGTQRRCHSCSATQGRTCSVDGCERAHSAFGYCRMHCRRWKAHGDTLPRKGGKPREARTEEQLLRAFNDRFIKAPNGCWEWQGRPRKQGYGGFNVYGRTLGAHKAAYVLLVGPVPDGLCVCHTCDNRICVNPAHLWLGTIAENNADMLAKGRARWSVEALHSVKPAPRRGELNGEAKLTATQALAIRADPRLQRVIAAEYGVSKALVSHIKTCRLWKHLP